MNQVINIAENLIASGFISHTDLTNMSDLKNPELKPEMFLNWLMSVQIYDITGKWVRTLMDEELKPGHHTIQWNASGFSSGVYFVRLQSGDFSKSQKLILLK